MASSFRLGILAAAYILCAGSAQAQEALILVRHAEKVDQSKDPHLSEAGQARARALAGLLGKSGVAAIYATEYQRTAETAAPLAGFLGLSFLQVPAADTAGLVERLRTRHSRDVVVVVGHSNTLPEIAARYGVSIPAIADDDFGNVFVVVPRPGGPAALLRLRY